MDDYHDSPTTEQLLKRIIQLEGMAALVKKQQGEINGLKAQIVDLGGAFKTHVTNTSDNFKYLFQKIADIHDQLWPLIHKVFPGSAETQKQIAAIKRNGGRSWDDKKPTGDDA